MIFKIFGIAFMVWVGCLNSVLGASYSKVFVQGGQEVIPVKYVQYGAPSVSLASPQIAKISAAPMESVVPVAPTPNLIAPCIAPCVYTGSAVPSVAQTAPATPNLVTYKSNIPVVVTNSEDPTGYEYSYVIYDGDTGDHKAQQESSDGSVVRGQYSLIQPDGYVREVYYTADDLNGFNAVVKKFLPEKVEAKQKEIEKDPVRPCNKHGSLKSSGHQEKHSEVGHLAPPTEEHHGVHPPIARTESHEAKDSGVKPEPTSSEETSESSEEQIHTPTETHGKPSEALTEVSSESSEENEPSKEVIVGHEQTHALIEHETALPHEPRAEVHSEHSQPPQHEITEHVAQDGPSYYNILKCIQNALNSKNQIAAPLTYIILNTPC